MNHPTDRHYANTHEWLITTNEADIYLVGISDYAQQALGDVVHASLPSVGQMVSFGEACCTLESVKAASDVHAPMNGEIIAVNPALDDSPELINDEPYTEGWLFKIKGVADTSQLMSAADYEQQVDA